jgi:acetyltransferase-like isoleucine patch superfamily enzyme
VDTPCMRMSENVKEKQDSLIAFIKSGRQKFTFEVDCPLSERIDYIFNVLFAGWGKQRFYIRHLAAKLACFIDYSPIKCVLYRWIGVNVGKGVFISPDVWIDPHIPSLIEIQDYVIIGFGARIFTHEFSGTTYTVGRVTIEEGAIVGAYAIIRGGVTIGSKRTVPMNNVIAKDFLAN